MNNAANEALENKTLDPEELSGVNGGMMMDRDEMWEHVAYQCLSCPKKDKFCHMALDGWIEEFDAVTDGTKLDIVCPKGMSFKELQ